MHGERQCGTVSGGGVEGWRTGGGGEVVWYPYGNPALVPVPPAYGPFPLLACPAGVSLLACPCWRVPGASLASPPRPGPLADPPRFITPDLHSRQFPNTCAPVPGHHICITGVLKYRNLVVSTIWISRFSKVFGNSVGPREWVISDHITSKPVVKCIPLTAISNLEFKGAFLPISGQNLVKLSISVQ